MLRLNIARGFGTGLVTVVVPAKVFYSLKDVSDVEIKNPWLMQLTHYILRIKKTSPDLYMLTL